MVSDALIEWQRIGLARLDQLEQLHTSATGTAPGRRWGTEQFNRTLCFSSTPWWTSGTLSCMGMRRRSRR